MHGYCFVYVCSAFCERFFLCNCNCHKQCLAKYSGSRGLTAVKIFCCSNRSQSESSRSTGPSPLQTSSTTTTQRMLVATGVLGSLVESPGCTASPGWTQSPARRGCGTRPSIAGKESRSYNNRMTYVAIFH